ncbi:MAG: GNAT family N-acetyltransferase [Flavobacteriales bacterium]
MSFVVRKISAEATRPVRHQVLWPHQPAPEACIIENDDDESTRHFGVFLLDGTLVGVCSMFDQRSERYPLALPKDDIVRRLRVMGTLPEVRGQGAGAALIEAFCAEARLLGAHWVWCDAREVAFGFYERMGFTFRSDAYVVPKIGRHKMMARRL